MKQHVKLNSCRHKGFGMGSGFEITAYCMKQHEEPTEAHLKLYCNDCPDFEYVEYDIESETNTVLGEIIEDD